MNFSIFMVLELLLVLGRLNSLMGETVVLEQQDERNSSRSVRLQSDRPALFRGYLPIASLVDPSKDTSEFWRAADIASLVHSRRSMVEVSPDCREEGEPTQGVRPPSRRNVGPICHAPVDYQTCPQCPHFTNNSECELFRESCKERRVEESEQGWYCQRKYGQWRSVLIPADPSQCRCCDECVFYRELDQSCVPDEFDFNIEEFLPVTSIDLRAGCNPYWGHPEQELRGLRCDATLKRCVPATAPTPVPKETRRSSRFEPVPADADCPFSCRGYQCKGDTVEESQCRPGAFLPERSTCNCCGRCSPYLQLNEKCADFKKTEHENNGTKDTEVEEKPLEPGCDEGLVCRQGYCQDIHEVPLPAAYRRSDDVTDAYEPCKRELKIFKKKYGPEGHLHYDAPQCTPLWLYAPVQCRGFVCYCALEDGTFIQGIKVPRVEVSNMNCDCAREKCRTGSEVECDGYGNYREAVFTPHIGNGPYGNLGPTPTSLLTAPTHTQEVTSPDPTPRVRHPEDMDV